MEFGTSQQVASEETLDTESKQPWTLEKKKWKKWAKKTEKGEVQSSNTYLICRYSFNLMGTPSLRYVTDKTREKSEHNLLVSELRSFLLSIFYQDQPIPRNFEVKNRGYIRYIVHIHISDLEDALSVLSLSHPVYTVKINKNCEEIPNLSDKLLTIPFHECAVEELMSNPSVDVGKLTFSSPLSEIISSNANSPSMETIWKQLHAYLPNTSMLKLYNFPLLISSEKKIDGSGVNKKLKCEDITKELLTNEMEDITPIVGEEIGNTAVVTLDAGVNQIGLDLLPSLAELDQLQSIFPQYQTVQYYQDFPKNQILVENDKFIETFDYPSTEYDSLWLGKNGRDQCLEPFKLIALDCEMCETTKGVEVTRVTALNHNEETILDVLLKPDNPIVDYRTQFSGITEQMLAPITTKLIQVQLLLCRWIVKKTLIIGHSLENDLRVLHLSHQSIIDTTFLYPHPIGFPYRNKLKYLAKEYLKSSIQQSKSGQAGHDSVEDAKAALQLTKLKLAKGPLFGIPNAESIRIPVTKRLSYLNMPSLLFDYRASVSSDTASEKDKQVAFDEKFLETLLSSRTTILKRSDLNEILQELKEFVLKNQRTAETELSKGNSEELQVLGKRKQSEIEEPNELSQTKGSYDTQHFIHLRLSAKTLNNSSISTFLHDLQQTLQVTKGSAIQTHGLCIVTSQKSLHSSYDLQEKKRKVMAFQQKMTTLTWTREEEVRLKELNKINNLGQVSFITL